MGHMAVDASLQARWARAGKVGNITQHSAGRDKRGGDRDGRETFAAADGYRFRDYIAVFPGRLKTSMNLLWVHCYQGLISARVSKLNQQREQPQCFLSLISHAINHCSQRMLRKWTLKSSYIHTHTAVGLLVLKSLSLH